LQSLRYPHQLTSRTQENERQEVCHGIALFKNTTNEQDATEENAGIL